MFYYRKHYFLKKTGHPSGGYALSGTKTFCPFSYPPSLSGVSSIFTTLCLLIVHALIPPLPPSPFLLPPLPRLWCPWGPAEAPIKPAVNGSNPVINGCVLQTRVWGCCSHGFIRWNGIGTHACPETHTQTVTDVMEAAHECVWACAHSHTHAHKRAHLYSFRWNHICSDCAAFMDAMQEQPHYYL